MLIGVSREVDAVDDGVFRGQLELVAPAQFVDLLLEHALGYRPGNVICVDTLRHGGHQFPAIGGEYHLAIEVWIEQGRAGCVVAAALVKRQLFEYHYHLSCWLFSYRLSS
jgi:hypothetical protein